MEFLNEWGETLGKIGAGGAAVVALYYVWNRLISMADQHRLDNAAREKAHRGEIKDLQERHEREKSEIVSRNLDIHAERERVQVRLAMAVASALASVGRQAPDPYPGVDEFGREDPRS